MGEKNHGIMLSLSAVPLPYGSELNNFKWASVISLLYEYLPLPAQCRAISALAGSIWPCGGISCYTSEFCYTVSLADTAVVFFWGGGRAAWRRDPR